MNASNARRAPARNRSRALASVCQAAADPARQLEHRDIVHVLSGLLIPIVMAGVDQTIVGPALPAIAQEMSGTDRIDWLATGFFLAVAVTTPLAGKLADIHGRPSVLLGSIGLFMAGSLLCAISSGIGLAIAGRVMQGAGAGALLSTVMTVSADMIPPGRRARYLAITTTAYMAGCIAGPIIGGWLIEHVGWRAVFWLNMPLGLLALLTCRRTLRKLPRHDHWHQLDVVGAALMAVAILTLLLAVSQLAGDQDRTSVALWAWPATLSFALWIALGLRLRTATEPLMPPELLLGRTTLPALVASGSTVGAFSALVVFVPVCLYSLGLSPSQTGLALTPLAAGNSIGGIVSAHAAGRVGDYTRLPRAALVVAITSSLALGLWALHVPLGVVLIALGLISLATGMTSIVCLIAVQNALPVSALGIGTAVVNSSRSVASAVAVAVIASLLPVSKGSVSAFDMLMVGQEVSGIAPDLWQRVFLSVAILYAVALLALAGIVKQPLRSVVVDTPRGDVGPQRLK